MTPLRNLAVSLSIFGAVTSYATAALGFLCSILTGGWETWKNSSLPTESIS